jgi:hypothetical protein
MYNVNPAKYIQRLFFRDIIMISNHVMKIHRAGWEKPDRDISDKAALN